MTTYEEVCHREASALPGGEIAVRTLLDWEIARAKLSDTDYIEAIRSHGPCDVANVTAADLIEAFGGDVELLIVLARRLAPDGATSRLVPEGPGSGTETPGCGPFSDLRPLHVDIAPSRGAGCGPWPAARWCRGSREPGALEPLPLLSTPATTLAAVGIHPRVRLP